MDKIVKHIETLTQLLLEKLPEDVRRGAPDLDSPEAEKKNLFEFLFFF